METDLHVMFQQLGVSLGLGLLVGLQRERIGSPLAGIRTYPLIALFGTICGFLAQEFGGLVIAAGLVAMAAIVLIGNYQVARSDHPDPPGLTGEVAMALMFTLGCFLPFGPMEVAVPVGGAFALLLYFKPQMHSLARKIIDKDFKAFMHFALVALVILPTLPNTHYGPYQVWNPFKIWLMVVLLVGISFGGYLLFRLFGPRGGTLAAGLLGGLISSTATTVSYARRTRGNPKSTGTASVVILLASAVAYGRVLFLIFVAAPGLLREAALPIGIMMGSLLALAFWLWWRERKNRQPPHEPENPSELRAAILFGALYAVVLLLAAAAREYFGKAGLVGVATISGLTDMDAITLSISQMTEKGQVDGLLAWKLILLASLANLFFKAVLAGVMGDRKFFRRLALYFLIVGVIGTGLFLL